MCYEKRDEEFSKVCKERDELLKELHETKSELVRCKDCKHGDIVMETDDGSKYMVCKLQKFWVNPGFFCANGKRKDGE
jgi:hypothetical protein